VENIVIIIESDPLQYRVPTKNLIQLLLSVPESHRNPTKKTDWKNLSSKNIIFRKDEIIAEKISTCLPWWT
jgi:hypothetical protein